MLSWIWEKMLSMLQQYTFQYICLQEPIQRVLHGWNLHEENKIGLYLLSTLRMHLKPMQEWNLPLEIIEHTKFIM